jgi:hypothetical protein
MLKLTRHLYSWDPRAHWFDVYERIQLNHILAHQNPANGRFVYFMPLAAGARRTFSEPEDSFWCCVGSGMESHAKHADSIWWSDAATLYLNLYVPSDLDWPERGLALTLDTPMPARGEATLTVRRAPRGSRGIALRLPGWAAEPRVTLNGAPVAPTLRDGYATIARRWRSGDRLHVTLPMRLTAEPTPDDPSIVAFTHGPVVLAADLGPVATPFEGIGPALIVSGDAAGALRPAAGDHGFVATDALGQRLALAPFYDRYERRTAVYFPTFTAGAWAGEKAAYLDAQRDAQALARRTVDTVYLGEMQPERDHAFAATRTEVVNWNGRSARRIGPGGTLSLTLGRRPGPATLRVIVWGNDVATPLGLSVDGTPVAAAATGRAPEERFVAIDHPLPSAGAQGRPTATVRFAPPDGALIYEVRMLAAEDGVPVTAA